MEQKQSFSRTVTIENTERQDSITVNLEFDVTCACPEAGSYVRSAPKTPSSPVKEATDAS